MLQEIVFMWSLHGSSGKTSSTLVELAIYPEMVTMLQHDVILSRHKAEAGRATTHLNTLVDKYIGFINELTRGDKLDEELMKNVTDPAFRAIRKLYQDMQCSV